MSGKIQDIQKVFPSMTQYCEDVVWFCTVRYGGVQRSTVQKVLYIIVRVFTVQYNTVRYLLQLSTVQNSKNLQYSEAQ